MVTTLIIVRHGETAWNKDLRFRGLSDLSLNETGFRQAEAAGARIAAQYRPVAVFSSPVRRAMQTAETIARPLNLIATPRDGLIDIDFGDFAGLTFPEAEARFPEQYHNFFHSPDRVHFPNGEALTDVTARLEALLPELYAAYPNEQVVLVSHQVTLRALMCVLLGIGLEHFWKFTLDTVSISEVQIDRGNVSLVHLNETCHLKALA